MVDFADTPEQAEFRAVVRQFIQEHCPKELIEEAPFQGSLAADHMGPMSKEERRRLARQWRDAVHERGWLVPAWPKEYGGGELTQGEQFILNEEMAAARAPGVSGDAGVGSTILMHGSDEMKQEYLPRILGGELRFCQGYSEPGAGSDLASLNTRAVRDGDEFVINGQKIWTSNAHESNMIFALVRTDPEAPKHRGITYLLFSLDQPGVSIRRIVQMSEADEFNEVFFEDARAPVSGVVGEINNGWYVSATHLALERSGIGGGHQIRHVVNDLIAFLQQEREAGSGRQRLDREESIRGYLADCTIDAEVALLLSYRVNSMQMRGELPNQEASVTKMFRTELSQRVARAAVKSMGLYGQLFDIDSPYTPMRTKWSRMYLATISETIGGGTSEIQRNVIATRGLGLPRS